MSNFARSFRDLDVYKNALRLAVDVHVFCRSLPPEERYAMADQMRRASRSIAQNISEAWRKRRYKAAFVAKLSDAETEASEMQCCLDMCLLMDYMADEQYRQYDERYEVVTGQMVSMINDAERWCRL